MERMPVMSPDPGRRHVPDPESGAGALFYAILGGLATTGVLALLHHIHVIWS